LRHSLAQIAGLASKLSVLQSLLKPDRTKFSRNNSYVSRQFIRCRCFYVFGTLDELGKSVYRNTPAISRCNMRTIDYLNAVQSRYGLTSDYKLAQKLGITRGSVSYFRMNKGVMCEDTAAFVAQLLDLPPARVIAHANAERARRSNAPTLLQVWLDVAAKFGAEPTHQTA
jgi:transcriptional regulator with XRE-family HTH domain